MIRGRGQYREVVEKGKVIKGGNGLYKGKNYIRRWRDAVEGDAAG